MAKPDQPKDIKPKTEDDGSSKPKVNIPIDDNMKLIIINLVSTVLICILFISVNYILQSSLLNSKLEHIQSHGGESEELADEMSSEEVTRGIVVDLGDFILNLSDINPRKYLKVNVALEVSSKPEDHVVEESGGHGHGHGESTPAVSPVETEMTNFKPAFRDAVISTLSSKTSAELSSVAGKELAKEQMAEAINGIFAGEREVIRVSFGQFIIQ
jgi:flagellar basal body-associated protein FliL